MLNISQCLIKLDFNLKVVFVALDEAFKEA